jgi:hypothetical protein
MSQAPSHISTGSQGSLGPDDSISQVITPYFDPTFRYDLETHNDESTTSDILSSAPSDLLTTTIVDSSGATTHNYGGLGGTVSSSITSEISGMHLGVPAAFLHKRKARKGHCWLASNGTEIFEKGKSELGGQGWNMKLVKRIKSVSLSIVFPYLIKKSIESCSLLSISSVMTPLLCFLICNFSYRRIRYLYTTLITSRARQSPGLAHCAR